MGWEAECEMRVASLESAVAAVTLITAIVVVLWEIKLFYGLCTGRMRQSIPSAAAEACRSIGPRCDHYRCGVLDAPLSRSMTAGMMRDVCGPYRFSTTRLCTARPK
jgi:hypothetical protein